MRRAVLLTTLVALLTAGLVTSASAIKSGGFSLPTKRLESAYKIALFERRFSDDGCYPAPNALAKAVHKATGHKVGVAPNTGRLGHLNQVYVLKSGTNCNRLRMALRAVGGTYVLDSNKGTIRILGRKGAATPGLARTLRDVVLVVRADEAHHRDVNHGFANELAGLPQGEAGPSPPHIELEPIWKGYAVTPQTAEAEHMAQR
jgi:hypothetical protein